MTTYFRLAFLLMLALALPVLAEVAAPKDGLAEIKLGQLSVLLTLPVEINGKAGSLMVDSGASMTVLRDTAAKELKVALSAAPAGSAGFGVAGGLDKLMMGTITVKVPGQKPDAFPRLSGANVFTKIPALETADPGGEVFGVIGLSHLSAAAALVDTAGGTMRLDPAGKFQAPKGFLKLALKRLSIGPARTKDDGFLWSVPVKIQGKDGLMVVDTGATNSVLDEKYAKTAGIKLEKSDDSALGAGSTQATLSAGSAELILGGKVNLGKVDIHGSDLSHIRLGMKSAAGDAPFAGIIGLDQMQRVGAVVDCQRGFLYTTEKPDASAAPAQGDQPVDTAALVKALQQLAKAGDADAKAVVAKATANAGKVELSQEEVEKFTAKAREKGFLAK